jgi:hypothetical protein
MSARLHSAGALTFELQPVTATEASKSAAKSEITISIFISNPPVQNPKHGFRNPKQVPNSNFKSQSISEQIETNIQNKMQLLAKIFVSIPKCADKMYDRQNVH